MKKEIIAATQTLEFSFDGWKNGDGVIVAPELAPVRLHMSEVSPENATYAMLHGFAARIGDNAAIKKEASNNFTVTETMRRNAVLELVQHYQSGSKEWNVKASAKQAPLNPAIVNLAVKLGKSYAEAQAWFAAKLEAELAAME
jgi:hypothetical protein